VLSKRPASAIFTVIPPTFTQFQRPFTHSRRLRGTISAHIDLEQTGEQDMTRRRLAAGAIALLVVAPCMAHHSFGIFDQSRSVTLHGTVRELQWTNPHCFIQMLVTSQSTTSEWSIEMHSPSVMYRVGWRPGSFRPGEAVTVVINPLRDGTHGGSLVSATDSRGRTLTVTAPKP
jgi:hypothetical protein